MIRQSRVEEEVARHPQWNRGVREETEHLEEDAAVLIELADGSETGAIGVEERVAA